MADADRWTCGYCGQVFPVPVLARDHEAMHENEEDPGEAATSRGVDEPG